jgi:hypothetical protein
MVLSRPQRFLARANRSQSIEFRQAGVRDKGFQPIQPKYVTGLSRNNYFHFCQTTRFTKSV